MSIAQTHAQRTLHDLSHLVFSAGEIGRLQTLSVVPVLGGDSFQQMLAGSLKLSPLRRGLSLDSVVEVFSFYIPHRHVYGEEWNEFLLDGIQSSPLTSDPYGVSTTSFLGMNVRDLSSLTGNLPTWRWKGYENIFNNYFKFPDDEDTDIYGDILTGGTGGVNSLNLYGLPCTHKKTIWTHKLPEKRSGYDYTVDVEGEEATISLQDLNAQYGALHTEQERELFGQRFRDVVRNLGGRTPYDADNRPRLLNRTESWASGYDVDGTDESSLGQHTGRVNQAIKHSVPRFAVPEHGAVWTVALVRFPPVHLTEAHYLDMQNETTYLDIAGDPALVGNQPRKEVRVGDLFNDRLNNNIFGDIPHSQWYRMHPNTVHHSYDKLQGFPFVETLPEEQHNYVEPATYDSAFQTTQLGHWNIQARNNVTVMRALPTARDALITNN